MCIAEDEPEGECCTKSVVKPCKNLDYNLINLLKYLINKFLVSTLFCGVPGQTGADSLTCLGRCKYWFHLSARYLKRE